MKSIEIHKENANWLGFHASNIDRESARMDRISSNYLELVKWAKHAREFISRIGSDICVCSSNDPCSRCAKGLQLLAELEP